MGGVSCFPLRPASFIFALSLAGFDLRTVQSCNCFTVFPFEKAVPVMMTLTLDAHKRALVDPFFDFPLFFSPSLDFVALFTRLPSPLSYVSNLEMENHPLIEVLPKCSVILVSQV